MWTCWVEMKLGDGNKCGLFELRWNIIIFDSPKDHLRGCMRGLFMSNLGGSEDNFW